MKELKLQKSHKSGPAGRKRKKYMYFDRLLFLMPTVENKRYQLGRRKRRTVDVRSAKFDLLSGVPRPLTLANRRKARARWTTP